MWPAYRNIGNVYDSQGRYEEALFHHQKALEVFLALFGQEHPDVAKSRNGIGNVLVRMGKHEEALVQYQKALEVFLTVYGQEHPLVADAKENIGLVYEETGVPGLLEWSVRKRRGRRRS